MQIYLILVIPFYVNQQGSADNLINPQESTATASCNFNFSIACTVSDKQLLRSQTHKQKQEAMYSNRALLRLE